MKKAFLAFCLIIALSLCGCSHAGYEQTETTEAALEAYYAAIRESVAQREGEITISIRLEDTVVNQKTSTETYHYDYKVSDDGSEWFDYKCYDDTKKLISHYQVQDGSTVQNMIKEEVQADFTSYLRHNTNPISTLQMFRMDANFKVRHDTISAITMEQQGDQTLVKVSFHGDKLTGQTIKSEGGLNRTVISHERTYTIQNGRIIRIEIYDRENAQYDGRTGVMNTDTVVEVLY